MVKSGLSARFQSGIGKRNMQAASMIAVQGFVIHAKECMQYGSLPAVNIIVLAGIARF